MRNPTDRAMVATAWEWLKRVFGMLSGRPILVALSRTSSKGDKLNFLFSTHDGETLARLFPAPRTSLLEQLPAALGTDCPPVPLVPANPEPIQPLLPPPPAALEPLQSNRSQSIKLAVPDNKRRARTRARRRSQSSRRMVRVL